MSEQLTAICISLLVLASVFTPIFCLLVIPDMLQEALEQAILNKQLSEDELSYLGLQGFDDNEYSSESTRLKCMVIRSRKIDEPYRYLMVLLSRYTISLTLNRSN